LSELLVAGDISKEKSIISSEEGIQVDPDLFDKRIFTNILVNFHLFFHDCRFHWLPFSQKLHPLPNCEFNSRKTFFVINIVHHNHHKQILLDIIDVTE